MFYIFFSCFFFFFFFFKQKTAYEMRISDWSSDVCSSDLDTLPPSAYAFQATLGNGRRADCLLQLPNPPGAIAIDSKFPLESYEALRNAGSDEALIAAARRAFVTDLRRHVLDIAQRYIIPGETADSALLFLPRGAVAAELPPHSPRR